MHWETKKFISLALLQYLLYCGGLELSPQNLRGMRALSSVEINMTEQRKG